MSIVLESFCFLFHFKCSDQKMVESFKRQQSLNEEFEKYWVKYVSLEETPEFKKISNQETMFGHVDS